MASRGQGMSLKDWDPMRDDYNDSTYDAQYADENIDSGVQLDHNRLYVSNIPQTLSEEGLRMAFSKYGNIVKLFVTRDPKKRYAMVTYESPSEAKLAMMKLNRSEPLKLNVSISHKKKNQDSDEREKNNRRPNPTWNRAYMEESSSVSSKGNYNCRQQSTLSENDNESMTDGIDCDLHLELEQLKLENLRVQEEKLRCKQRILLLNRPVKNANLTSNRIVTLDGKVLLKTTLDRTADLPADATVTGAGDASKIPGLQRASQRLCINCGERAELFCSGCAITPYCGAGCQRVDWAKRHKTVCHNLARLADGVELPEANNNETEEVNNSGPSVHKPHPLRMPRSPRHRRPHRDDDDTSAKTDSDEKPAGAGKCDKKIQNSSSRGRNFSPRNVNLRRPHTHAHRRAEIADEHDSVPNENVQVAKKTVEQNGVVPNVQANKPGISQRLNRPTIRPETEESRQQHIKEVVPVAAPKIDILPKLYLVATLSVGDTVLLSVDSLAKECGTKQQGYICISIHESSEANYQLLCADYCADCDADSATITPNPGDFFSYRNPADGAWYRARRLSSAAAALVDSSKIAAIAPAVACKRVPAKYAHIPEFCCVLDADCVKLGESYQATIVAKQSGDAVSVKLHSMEGAADVGLGTITRWLPEVEMRSASEAVQPPVTKPISPQSLNVRTPIRPKEDEIRQQDKVVVPVAAPKIEILPKLYLMGTLSVGDTVPISVDSLAKDCGTKQRGYICISIHESSEANYQLLCADYCAVCDNDSVTITPNPGDLFSYRNPADGAWYRARRLSAAAAALVDSSKLAAIAPADACKRVPAQYAHIPEFCCVLDADCVKLGESYQATIVAKQSGDAVSVKLHSMEGDADVGLGTITRWLPEVEMRSASEDVQPPATKPVSPQSPNVPPTISPREVGIRQQDKVVVPVAAPKIEILPKLHLMATLSVGDTVAMSVDSLAKDCGTKQQGYICISIHESSEANYRLLCADYCAVCDNDSVTITPNPGDLFSYRNPADGAWYRARRLSAAAAALVDSSKLAAIAPADACKRVPAQYAHIPEFCCVLDADCVKLGESYQATILSKQGDSVRVKLCNAGSDIEVGQGTISRWLPEIQVPNVAAAAPLPEVPRPRVANNSRVLLIDADTIDRVFVRVADADTANKYNAAVQDTLLHGRSAKPLTQPPMKGQVVISKFSDGNHYRALVKRTSVKKNKYLLEYIEFGNVEIGQLENLYPCPEEINLDGLPTVVSLVKVNLDNLTLTAAAKEYLERLRDAEIELTLTLPDGAKSAPSGSEVILTVERNKQNVNKHLVELCTPEWKKMAVCGTDVVELEPLMFHDLDVIDLPKGDVTLKVLNHSTLEGGVVAGCPGDSKHADYVLNTLSEQLAEYCNSELGKAPYLPKPEELCIARSASAQRWLRAVMLEQVTGAGGALAQVCFLDSGEVETVPVTHLRKMLPDFMRDLPALASLVQIRGFPVNCTPEMLNRAINFLKIDGNGHGVLALTDCRRTEPTMYEADAPALLAAMGH